MIPLQEIQSSEEKKKYESRGVQRPKYNLCLKFLNENVKALIPTILNASCPTQLDMLLIHRTKTVLAIMIGMHLCQNGRGTIDGELNRNRDSRSPPRFVPDGRSTIERLYYASESLVLQHPRSYT